MTSADLFETDIHPRILFGPDDVPGLREKAASGIPAKALAEILRRAERYTDPKSSDCVDVAESQDQAVVARGVADALHCLAFAYVLTDDEAWSERSAPIFRACVEERGAARLGCQFALAFDLLCNALDPALAQTLGEAIRKESVEAYQETQLTGKAIWGLGTNMFVSPFIHYVVGLAAVYDAQVDRPAFEAVEGYCRRSIHRGIDEGGAIYEGPSYGHGDAHNYSITAEILRRAGIADLWATEPRFVNMARHWVHLLLPGKRGQNTPCDAWRLRPNLPIWTLLLHARRMDDPVLQWAWEQMRNREDVEGFEPMPRRLNSDLGFLVLWEDDHAVAKRPDEAGWPNSRNSGGMGFITMRSGWDDEDTYFSMMASGRTPGCCIHQHLDGGHFCLFALNEAFSIDSGYGDVAGRYHSVLRPGAEEPYHSPIDFDQEHIGGQVAAFHASDQVDYACVDVSRQWETRWYFRHGMLVKAPGTEPYVVLLDDANYRDDLSCYEWLMNGEPGNRIELDRDNEKACVFGKRHRLDVAWAYPDDQGYPTIHRLDLAKDEIDSFRLPHRNQDVDYYTGTDMKMRPRGGARWGIGIRPRLKATLWGYTGHLLTVLMPRREGEPTVEVERLSSPSHFGMAIRWGEVTDTILASPADRYLSLAGVEGEAMLTVVRRDRNGNLLWWAAADAWMLEVDGNVVLPRAGEPRVLAQSGDQP